MFDFGPLKSATLGTWKEEVLFGLTPVECILAEQDVQTEINAGQVGFENREPALYLEHEKIAANGIEPRMQLTVRGEAFRLMTIGDRDASGMVELKIRKYDP